MEKNRSRLQRREGESQEAYKRRLARIRDELRNSNDFLEEYTKAQAVPRSLGGHVDLSRRVFLKRLIAGLGGVAVGRSVFDQLGREFFLSLISGEHAASSSDNSDKKPSNKNTVRFLGVSHYPITGIDAFTNASATADLVNSRFYHRLIEPGDAYPLFEGKDSDPSYKDAGSLSQLGVIDYAGALGNDMCFGAVLVVDALRKATRRLGMGEPVQVTNGFHKDAFVEWWGHKNYPDYATFLKTFPYYPPDTNNAAVYWEGSGALTQDLLIKNPKENDRSLGLGSFMYRESNQGTYRLLVYVYDVEKGSAPLHKERRCIVNFRTDLYELILTQGKNPAGSHPNDEYDYALGSKGAQEADPGSTRGQIVVAHRDGVVSGVAENNLWGKYTLLKHGDGNETYVGHLDQHLAGKGKIVPAGGLLGVLGATGVDPSSGGPVGSHVHFQQRRPDGSYVKIEDMAWAKDPTGNPSKEPNGEDFYDA